MASPTTTDARLRDAARLGSGFLYAISRLGVTGVRDQVAQDIPAAVARIKRPLDASNYEKLPMLKKP